MPCLHTGVHGDVHALSVLMTRCMRFCVLCMCMSACVIVCERGDVRANKQNHSQTFLFLRRLRRYATDIVKVNEHDVNVRVVGDGPVTVVLDAGLGMSSLSWIWVERVVAKTARVVTFDRPSLGCSPRSDSGAIGMSSHAHEAQQATPQVSWMRSVGDIVCFMHRLLDTIDARETCGREKEGDGKGRKRKLVLVGHSTAGMHARLYCHRYPEEVAGLVLVDTASEKQLGLMEGTSVYNSYPQVHETDAKLQRVKLLFHSGLFFLMYWISGERKSERARERECVCVVKTTFR